MPEWVVREWTKWSRKLIKIRGDRDSLTGKEIGRAPRQDADSARARARARLGPGRKRRARKAAPEPEKWAVCSGDLRSRARVTVPGFRTARRVASRRRGSTPHSFADSISE